MNTERIVKRCAVYTRKSSEEGLDQDFNSLQAQREACEAYITSQRHEGWKLVPTAYDDGGISGGTMERPALKNLLSDIQEKRVDVIVVYKVDRLTRSLADFAKMVEVFDAHNVSFVAVTQQFNTTTSMGRLTLNVLLSFAQFEREVTGERIRDKIAASKRKGIWMGGVVPLGYRVADRKLIVVPEEAAKVRQIFQRYLTCAGIRELAIALKGEGITGLRQSSRGGISRGALYNLLRNRIYIGQLPHKGEYFPGQHRAIVDLLLWEAVQAKLKDGGHPFTRKTEGSPLAGKLFDEAGRKLTPTHARKGNRRYRYYVTHSDDLDVDRESDGAARGWRLPAAEIERRVAEIVLNMVKDPAGITEAVLSATGSSFDVGRIASRARRAKEADVLEWVQRVEIATDRLTVKIVLPGEPAVHVEKTVPISQRRRGHQRRLVMHGECQTGTEPDRFIIQALSRGMRLWERMRTDPSVSALGFAGEEGIDNSAVGRSLPLVFLAPDIVKTLTSGRQHSELTARRLLSLESMPLNWGAQRQWLRIGSSKARAGDGKNAVLPYL